MAHHESEHCSAYYPEEVLLSPEETLIVWQHFENIGGHDKDRMVTIIAFLTPVLLGIIGFAYEVRDSQPELSKIAGLAGLVMALVAAMLVLMYAGYANRNWEKADKIANLYLNTVRLKGIDKAGNVMVRPLSQVLNPKKSFSQVLNPKKKSFSQVLNPKKMNIFYPLGWFFQKLARALSLPHDPGETLAPIFMIFFILAIVLGVLSWDIAFRRGILLSSFL